MEQAINIPKKTLLAHFKKGEGVTFTQYGLDMVIVERKQLNKVLNRPLIEIVEPKKKKATRGLSGIEQVEKSPYNPAFVKRILKEVRGQKLGKGKIVKLEDLWK